MIAGRGSLRQAQGAARPDASVRLECVLRSRRMIAAAGGLWIAAEPLGSGAPEQEVVKHHFTWLWALSLHG